MSSPAIASDGTIYVGTADSDSNNLFAISPNGSQKWECPITGSIRSSPAIAADGTIYVGSTDKSFYAITPDGKQKWAFPTGDSIYSSPAIAADGTIYVGSDDRNLYAITSDGKQKWAFPTGNSIYSSPAIAADGTIYVGSDDGNLYAITPEGKKKWSFPTDKSIVSSPAIAADGTIYVGSGDENLYAISPSGKEKWRFAFGQFVTINNSAVITEDGTIIIAAANKLYALSPNREEKWDLFDGQNSMFSSAAVASDGTIYIAVGNKLYAVDSKNPQEAPVLIAETGDFIKSSPTISSDGTVYFGSDDGKLYAVKTNSGGLASTPWPKFRKDIENTGRGESIEASQTQATGVEVAIQNSCSKELDTTDLNSKYQSGDFEPITEVVSFNATVSSNGATATFRISSTSIPTGKVSDLILMKFYNTGGTSKAYKNYALSGPEYNLDGYWWVTDADGNYMSQTDDVTLGTEYYIYFVVKDNGDYDEDSNLGKITDPVAVGTGSGSSGTGCTLNPQATFSVEWLLLMLSPLLLRLRYRLRR
ncbi:PQQ-binding-like beta-propeller repeat protein [Maridesulfovibrio sp.]|uniref:PQQ-binding-like beta-propeller repeat protein n=1 Tax=Maridesulfovibrio sp. TaxID=2795000 RepID=UPI0029C9E31B|nr:PQQ-binding-like beta-propeller repeat protein [Maridesulfovibrio sp.]